MDLLKALLFAFAMKATFAANPPYSSKRGSVTGYLPSTKIITTAEIAYKMCLSSIPIHVNATARPSNPSDPHTFYVTVLEIEIHQFQIELERVGPSNGLDVIVEWEIFFGDGIVYNDKYLWMPFPHQPRGPTKTEAAALCSSFGGSLVDIVDKDMYDVVLNYVNSTYVSDAYAFVQIFLAMTFNPANLTVTQSNGQPGYDPSADGLWISGHGLATSGEMIGLQVAPIPKGTTITGFWNSGFSSIWDAASPLCAFKIV